MRGIFLRGNSRGHPLGLVVVNVLLEDFVGMAVSTGSSGVVSILDQDYRRCPRARRRLCDVLLKYLLHRLFNILALSGRNTLCSLLSWKRLDSPVLQRLTNVF